MCVGSPFPSRLSRAVWRGQLAALYSEKHRVYETFHHVHMHMAFRALADAMTVMVTLDELMKQNPSFRGAFAPFKRCVALVVVCVGGCGCGVWVHSERSRAESGAWRPHCAYLQCCSTVASLPAPTTPSNVPHCKGTLPTHTTPPSPV